MFQDSLEKSLAEQIYPKIREDITRQRVKCGEKINFSELKKRFGVSHTPLREAFKRLEQEGLVQYIPNIGYRVIQLDQKDISETIDLISILDCSAIKLAMKQGRVEELVKDLKVHLDGQSSSDLENCEEEYLFHLHQFHKVFYKYADNRKLSSTALQIQGLLDIITSKYHEIESSRQNGIVEHKQILEAVSENDIGKAILMMEYHYANSKSILLQNFH
ncbi:GntR family transcriptional regulator [Neobacillus niacini]|uniref:GntR family transcriptional regulator n=1 Tax=Neobacillus niacini TaxID=86668 RepID=UPI00285FC667|nr:GntR family transcriptional regulator [Neobacillus niacini]MDR6997651.1 DNA-binding GntR family transcriptional regulator [Neobacillus niacini]